MSWHFDFDYTVCVMSDYHEGQVVYHEKSGAGRVINVSPEKVIVNFIKSGMVRFDPDTAADELSDTPFETATATSNANDFEDMKTAIREVLHEEGIIGVALLADRWDGGEVILKPGNPALKEKVIPIGTLFHKIVMIRDRLRVLEQNINSSSKLSEIDKAGLQQYITKCYGSLTTFNVLFADKDDWFVGDKKE